MADLTLVLEASTGTATLALLRGHHVIADASVVMRGPDGERLMPTLVQMLGEAGTTAAKLARIACGAGPGGFTSLRISAAIAKGLAESLGVELWAMSSLALLAAGDRAAGSGGPVIAILDAQRGEWYTRAFARNAESGVTPLGAVARLGRAALQDRAERTGATILGVGGETFPGGRSAAPVARDLVHLAAGDLFHPVDLATWEPDYGRLAEAQVQWEAEHGRALEQSSEGAA